jgi:hypothetical protein
MFPDWVHPEDRMAYGDYFARFSSFVLQGRTETDS